MQKWLHEVRCWGAAGPFASEGVMWMDNASGHALCAVYCKAAEDNHPVSPPNTTNYVHLLIDFRFSKSGYTGGVCASVGTWRLFRRGDWKQGAKSSGALANPGKQFFLEAAAECIRLVNAETDKNNLNWAKKSMMLCGLDVGSNGKWNVEQLSKPLQEIVVKYRADFDRGYEEAKVSASV